MRTIAVIDDPDSRLLVRAQLGDRYRVVEYGSVDAAMAGLAHAAPDLVLIDASRSEFGGLRVLQRMRGEPRLARVPVVALSAEGRSEDRDRFLHLGYTEYVSKPVTDDGLLERVVSRCLAVTGASS
jgi:CheY-like chemotaxis protein